MSLKGMRFTVNLDPGTASKTPCANSASSSASFRESLTSAMSATLSTHFRRLGGFCNSASMSPCHSSTMLCFVVGTSFRLKSSLAAWTLHARTQRAVDSCEKASGAGATVETVTLDAANWK